MPEVRPVCLGSPPWNRPSSLDFLLPNATTWFYFSFFLAVALFFQFARPFSLRNLDLLTLFLLVPGFLLIQEAPQTPRPPERDRS